MNFLIIFGKKLINFLRKSWQKLIFILYHQMSIKNIQECVAAKVINYLKERDNKLQLYEKMLKHVDICAACHKIIGGRTDDYICLHDHDDNTGYQRCCNAYESDGGCKFIVCIDCEKVYPWYKNNSWFGVHPRPIDDCDYYCPDCGGF